MTYKTDGNGAADSSLANYKRLRIGDIAFEGHTSKEFRYGRFVLNDVGDGIMSPRFSALRPLANMPVNFWKYYIHYEPIMRKVLVNSTKAGTMMNELVVSEFLRGSISVPFEAEQKRIGEILANLDNLITLHQRLYIFLIFQCFEKYTIFWEQRKLGDIAKTTIGEFVIKTKQDDSYPYPVYNGGSSNTGYYKEFNNEGNKILVSARGANAGFINIIKTRYWAGNSCYSIDLLDKNEFDIDFIFQEMKRNQAIFTENQQAANIPSVSKLEVEKFVVDVPSYDEQVKIGVFFGGLDNLITLHQRLKFFVEKCEFGYVVIQFVHKNYLFSFLKNSQLKCEAC